MELYIIFFVISIAISITCLVIIKNSSDVKKLSRGGMFFPSNSPKKQEEHTDIPDGFSSKEELIFVRARFQAIDEMVDRLGMCDGINEDVLMNIAFEIKKDYYKSYAKICGKKVGKKHGDI